jgi:hypothetical protein
VAAHDDGRAAAAATPFISSARRRGRFLASTHGDAALHHLDFHAMKHGGATLLRLGFRTARRSWRSWRSTRRWRRLWELSGPLGEQGVEKAPKRRRSGASTTPPPSPAVDLVGGGA